MAEAEEDSDSDDVLKIEIASSRSLLCRSQWDPDFLSNTTTYLRQWINWFSSLLHDIEVFIPVERQSKFTDLAFPILLQLRQAIRDCDYDQRRQRLQAENVANLVTRPANLQQIHQENVELDTCHQQLLVLLRELHELTRCSIPTRIDSSCRTVPVHDMSGTRNLNKRIRRDMLRRLESDGLLYEEYIDFMEFDDKCTAFVDGVLEYHKMIKDDEEQLRQAIEKQDTNSRNAAIDVEIEEVWRKQKRSFKELHRGARGLVLLDSTMSQRISSRVVPLITRLLPKFPHKFSLDTLRHEASQTYNIKAYLRRQLFSILYEYHEYYVENQIHNQQDQLPSIVSWESFIQYFVEVEFYVIGLRGMHVLSSRESIT